MTDSLETTEPYLVHIAEYVNSDCTKEGNQDHNSHASDADNLYDSEVIDNAAESSVTSVDMNNEAAAEKQYEEPLSEEDLDRDLYLQDDIYETIHYYSRNSNKNFIKNSYSFKSIINDSDEDDDDSSLNEYGNQLLDTGGEEIENSDLYESRSDIGTCNSSNLNSASDDIQSIYEHQIIPRVNKKLSCFSFNEDKKQINDECMGRSVSDSFINRIKGFRKLWSKKGSKYKTGSHRHHLKDNQNDESISESSHSKFDDSGMGSKNLNYGSTDFNEVELTNDDSSCGKNKKHNGFNPCCVG